MRVVDAYWELRNLGVSCSEVELRHGDQAPDVIRELALLDTSYRVVKVPAGEWELVKVVQAAGYCFVEAMCSVALDLTSSPIATDGYECPLAVVAADVARVHRNIGAEMFAADRVSLDPSFGARVAAVRYQYWVDDILEAGGEVCEVALQGEAIGFFTLRKGDLGVLRGELNGLYPVGRGRGFGRDMHRAILAHARASGGTKYLSNVSSNNVAGLRAAGAAGLIVTDVSHVFTRHA